MPSSGGMRLLVLAVVLLSVDVSHGKSRRGGKSASPAATTDAPKKGISRRKAKKQLEPPPFDCALPDWAPPKPEEIAELDLGWEYCDWEVRDTAPSDEEFRAKYWQQKPVIVRNFTRAWPATDRWSKKALWEAYGGREVSSFDSDTYLVSHAKWVPHRLADFLKGNVCEEKQLSKESQMHQEYVFDKDGMFSAVPELLEDYWHPPFVTQFFDEEVHEKFSRYFLVGSSMSGINYHSHTDAYNGLVHGRKRWFVYDDKIMKDPPSRSHGTLRWMREILPGLPDAQKPMQCMQRAGDLIYVPEGWWHGTINLGETIGVSGQFVRNTNKWARESAVAIEEERWDDAAALYLKMLGQPGPHDQDARFNRALALVRANRKEDALAQVEDFRLHWGSLSPPEFEIPQKSKDANEQKAAMLLQALGVAQPPAGQALLGVGSVVSHTTGKLELGFPAIGMKGEL